MLVGISTKYTAMWGATNIFVILGGGSEPILNL